MHPAGRKRGDAPRRRPRHTYVAYGDYRLSIGGVAAIRLDDPRDVPGKEERARLGEDGEQRRDAGEVRVGEHLAEDLAVQRGGRQAVARRTC